MDPGNYRKQAGFRDVQDFSEVLQVDAADFRKGCSLDTLELRLLERNKIGVLGAKVAA